MTMPTPTIITFRPERREPMPADGVLRSEWRVGKRTVTITQMVDGVAGSIGVLRAEWAPNMPQRRLNKRELREYRAGRALHSQRAANIIGGVVAVVDL
jgi:hypothetical protein